jgi:hypothetical protein
MIQLGFGFGLGKWARCLAASRHTGLQDHARDRHLALGRLLAWLAAEAQATAALVFPASSPLAHICITFQTIGMMTSVAAISVAPPRLRNASP